MEKKTTEAIKLLAAGEWPTTSPDANRVAIIRVLLSKEFAGQAALRARATATTDVAGDGNWTVINAVENAQRVRILRASPGLHVAIA